MARLTKSDVERLARDYDADPTGALTIALVIVTGANDPDWMDMVGRLPFDSTRRARLVARDTAALDELFRDLVELRDLPDGGDGR